MFAIEERNRVIVRHRPPGRLMRPSDRMISGHGLGELDGFLDTLKNFGSGVVKFATGGIYDPTKNRFFVPFSSGHVRNFSQGFVNTSTLGLVKTDKFFGSQTMRTIGTVVGAVGAAATAAVGARLASNYFSGTPTTGGAVTGAVGTASKAAVAQTAVKTVQSTGSLFSFDNIAKTLDVGAKVLQVGGQVMGGGQPQQQQQGPPMMMVDASGGGGMMYPPMLPGSLQPNASGLYAPAMYNPAVGGGYSGGSTMSVPGGGGGGPVGPPGSEYYIAEDGTAVPIEGGGESGNVPMWLLIGSGVVLAAVILSPSKRKK